MYIEITVSIKEINQTELDIRLSNHHTVKGLIEIVKQTSDVFQKANPLSWVRIVNKSRVVSSDIKLIDAGIMTGDKINILNCDP
ncbi:ubiquitin [Amphibacillus sp. MSJ-3]|uniref:EsaB/YukD family protein n=1 Tax=Amphibacillus sp. MSJ-3 TaxID=2841505 RepID=UPI001C0F0A81|nr:EsaB/YukD family protein [Amphibacillus sp. MSJ-3]MBU5594929.1 ubiquitin [Amphibacillus sp. MSJ-3]